MGWPVMALISYQITWNLVIKFISQKVEGYADNVLISLTCFFFPNPFLGEGGLFRTKKCQRACMFIEPNPVWQHNLTQPNNIKGCNVFFITQKVKRGKYAKRSELAIVIISEAQNRVSRCTLWECAPSAIVTAIRRWAGPRSDLGPAAEFPSGSVSHGCILWWR